MGKPLLMGRRTFQSIGKPLPGRQTIVLTRDRDYVAEGVHVAPSLDAAMALGGKLAADMGADRLMVVGGAKVYAETLPLAQRLHVTWVHAEPVGDVTFPSYDQAAFRETYREDHPAADDDEHPFTFVDYERRRTSQRGR